MEWFLVSNSYLETGGFLDGDLNFRREIPFWMIVDLSERRQLGVFGAGAQILAFSNPDIIDPILRKTSLQLALAIPLAANAVLQVLPEMGFLMDGRLIVIKPPLKPVPVAILDVMGLVKINGASGVGLCTPEVYSGPAFHGVGAD